MDADYLVVGGGPAGLAVAIQAKMAGKRAIVVERCRGPVDKACGEGLMPGGVEQLAAMGVEVPAWGSHPFRGIRYVDGEVAGEADFLEGPGMGIRRLALSEAMLKRAAELEIRLEQGCEAFGWEENGDGVTLQTSRGALSGRWLVAADGLHSPIRKKAGIPTTIGPARRLGIRRHFTVRPWSEHVEVWWGEGVEAYVTPTGPERVGVAFLWRGGKGDYDTFLGRFPALRERIGNAPAESIVRGAGPFDVSVGSRSKGRVLLVGDAAGYLDAITGEGISLGFAAAEALVRVTRDGGADQALASQGHVEAYEKEWQNITRRHRLLTGLLLKIARRPWLRRRVVRALVRSPRGFQAFLALNTGRYGYADTLLRSGGIGMRLLTG